MDEMRSDKNIRSVAIDEPGYPQALKEIKDPPKRLYYLGDLAILRSRCVSVIGSRTTTTYGRNTAKAMARWLASNGVTVVSGMAAGIDTYAHEGALGEGGKTVAVLGCGPDVCYPKENLPLMRRIERMGLIISEYGPGTQPVAYRFPQRNRIISGLSEMTLVVQARNRSGSLITAELAVEQGREVCAVPGNIDSQYNLGSNKLIQEGATPIVRVDDLADVMGLGSASTDRVVASLTPLERRLYEAIEERGEMSPDEVCLFVDDSPGKVAAVLSVLEIKGILCSASGKFFLANR